MYIILLISIFFATRNRYTSIRMRRYFCYTSIYMIITFHTKQFFKIQYGDRVIACNPPTLSTGSKVSRFGADIVLSSNMHPDMNGYDTVMYGDKIPFVISGPGDYEVGDVYVQGLACATRPGESQNTVYYLTMDNMNICFLGSVGSKDSITNEIREKINHVDILFVPVGNFSDIDPAKAHALAVSFNPSVIIPMGYDTTRDKNLVTFLKEAGAEDVTGIEKFTVKSKDISELEGKVVVLTA